MTLAIIIGIALIAIALVGGLSLGLSGTKRDLPTKP